MERLLFPNTYLVGAPKAGSSALMRMLNRHPEIHGCGIKEPNFHCRDLDVPGARSEEEYRQLCQYPPGKKILIDGSILNLYSTKAAESIHVHAPQAKILMVLRNPVEATYAWHSQMVFTGNEPIIDFQEALQAEKFRRNGQMVPAYGTSHRCPELLFYSAIMNYAEQIPRYTALFPPEQILILLQDDLRRDSIQECSKVYRFLGVSPFMPSIETTNRNKIRRSAVLHRSLKRLFAAPARAILPIQLRLKLILWLDKWNSMETPRPKLPPDFANALKEQFKPQVLELETMLGRRLAEWYT